jgi:hypothetical protein
MNHDTPFPITLYSLLANPLAQSSGQVQLDSDSEKYERICLNKYNLAIGQIGEKN